MEPIRGLDAWLTTPPEEWTTDDVSGEALLDVQRLRLGPDGLLVDTDVRVRVDVRRGEVQSSVVDATDEEIELTQAEDSLAVELVAEGCRP